MSLCVTYCNFLNLIFPWKQFVIRRPLNGKHIIFLKGHRVTHNPPTVPINKMASFSAAFGALGSKGGLPLNFKRQFKARKGCGSVRSEAQI